MRVGLDVGSTTIKCVVLDEDGQLLFSTYQRHFSHITEKTEELLSAVAERFPGREMRLFAVYSGDRAAGESWQAQVRAAFPGREVELAALPLSICCHIGSGALAIACAEV